MTTHETEILNHIIDGGAIVVSAFDEPITLDYIGSSLEDDWNINFDELAQCSIHHTPDQLTIIKLKQQLTDMTDKLKTIQTQKTKLGTDLREVNGSGPKSTIKSPYRAHLTTEELHEIEEIFKRDFSTPAKTVMTAYGISQPVCSRIRRGSHSKSSEVYRTHLRNVHQYNED